MATTGIRIGFGQTPLSLVCSPGRYCYSGIPIALASTVGGAIAITNSSLTNAVVGQTNTIALAATGATGSVLWSIDSCTPNESLLIYVDASGNLQWDYPQTLDTCSIILRATDSANSSNTTTRLLTWTSTTSGALTAVTTTLPNALNGTLYSQRILAKGGTPPYAVSTTQVNAKLTGGSSTTATDTRQNWPVNGLTGCWFYDLSTNDSNGSPLVGIVSSNTATVLTITNYNTSFLPLSGDLYALSPAQPWALSVDGWYSGASVTNGSHTENLIITDSAGAIVSITPSVTTATGNLFAGIDPLSNYHFCPNGRQGEKYSHTLFSYGGSGNITISSAPSWLSCSTGGVLTGTPTSTGTFSFTATQGSLTMTCLVMINPSSLVSRPFYNSNVSDGFFAANGKIYDYNGYEFRIVGTNRLHYNNVGGSPGTTGGFNFVRHWPAFDGSQSVAAVVTQLNSDYISNNIVPMFTCAGLNMSITGSIATNVLTVSSVGTVGSGNGAVVVIGMSLGGAASGGKITSQLTGTSGGVGTYQLDSNQSGSGTITGVTASAGNSDLNGILCATNQIVYALNNGLLAIKQKIFINICNEWGNAQGSPVTFAQWQSVYTTAVASIRATGYNGPIVIDNLQFGQEFGCVSGGYFASILATDAVQNLISSFHLYSCSRSQTPITGITKANPAAISLSQANVCFPVFPYSVAGGGVGASPISISGVTGMTQANGAQILQGNITGSAGSWGFTLAANSTAWGTYVSGGTVYEGRHYMLRAQTIAGFMSSGISCMVGEFGPENLNGTWCSIPQFVSAMQAYGIGHSYWAWDDNNVSGNQCRYYGWFGTTGATNTIYTNGQYSYVPQALTYMGQITVSNPRTGTQNLGRTSQVFL